MQKEFELGLVYTIFYMAYTDYQFMKLGPSPVISQLGQIFLRFEIKLRLCEYLYDSVIHFPKTNFIHFIYLYTETITIF